VAERIVRRAAPWPPPAAAAASEHWHARHLGRSWEKEKVRAVRGEKEKKPQAAMEDQADKQADGMSKEEKRALAIAKLAKVSMQS